jgi:hypothetical protein
MPRCREGGYNILHASESPEQLGLPETCPWEYTGLPFDGLCTHAAFIEGVNFGSHAQHDPSASDPDATSISEAEIHVLEVSAEERLQAFLQKDRDRYHMIKLMYPERWQAMQAKKSSKYNRSWPLDARKGKKGLKQTQRSTRRS